MRSTKWIWNSVSYEYLKLIYHVFYSPLSTEIWYLQNDINVIWINIFGNCTFADNIGPLGACPNLWTSYNGHCFMYFTEQKTWYDARVSLKDQQIFKKNTFNKKKLMKNSSKLYFSMMIIRDYGIQYKPDTARLWGLAKFPRSILIFL